MISWVAGFDYSFLPNLAYPMYVLMLASLMALLYFLRTGAAASAARSAVQGQPAIVTTW